MLEPTVGWNAKLIVLMRVAPVMGLALGATGAFAESAAESSVYMARVVSVSAQARDAYVGCLQQTELPRLLALKQQGLLLEHSAFETSSVHITAPEVPAWNFFFLDRVPLKTTQSQTLREIVGACDAAGIEVRRIETLRATPDSYPPKAGPLSERLAPTVQYVLEYIDVRETPTAKREYREAMRTSVGPAIGQLVRDGIFYSLGSFETASVEYTQPGMPHWNEIHVRGYFAEKGPSPPELDDAMKKVNPQRGGTTEVFARLDAVRSKAREDYARQLHELDVR
jgi:hypothetical protein